MAAVPHVNDLLAERQAQEAERERIERLGRRPAVPIPNTITELHAYLLSDGPVRLKTWMEANFPTISSALGIPIHDYPDGQRTALNLLVGLHKQAVYPSEYAQDPIDVEQAVDDFHGQPLWQWLYLQAYADHLVRQKALGNATRADLKAVLNRLKPIEPFALKQAQDQLKPLHN